VDLITHRIRRQRWLCSAGSPAEAFALRGSLREAQEAAVPASFERAFDAAVPGDEVVRLPRLELRIRLASVDDLAAALPELLARAVSEQLGRLLPPRLASPARLDGAAPALAADVPAGAPGSGGESLLAGLIIYLATGALPWELARAEASSLWERFRETASESLAAVLASAPDAQATLAPRLAFFFRLLQLLPVERWQEIAWHLSPSLPVARAAALGRALTGLASQTSPSGAVPGTLAPDVRRRLAAAALSAGRDLSERPAYALAKALAEALGMAPGMILSEVLARLALLSPEIAVFFKPWLEPVADVASPPEPDRSSISSMARVPSPDSPLTITEAVEEAFPASVRCAGLVLLHPFLPKLFESAGLLRAGEPGLSWAELPRAAALLHWLATGRDEVLEFELGFVKVLLGRRPEEPLLVDGSVLTAADREEGEALLQAAVQHWRALKGTTPAGLRASFLQRGGLLREDDAGWRLQVEPAAFDLLLDHLPWGIGVVKLPWMTRPVFTEWAAS
jgi:hypothetical protein